jgi:hypothetical protein
MGSSYDDARQQALALRRSLTNGAAKLSVAIVFDSRHTFRENLLQQLYQHPEN